MPCGAATLVGHGQCRASTNVHLAPAFAACAARRACHLRHTCTLAVQALAVQALAMQGAAASPVRPRGSLSISRCTAPPHDSRMIVLAPVLVPVFRLGCRRPRQLYTYRVKGRAYDRHLEPNQHHMKDIAWYLKDIDRHLEPCLLQRPSSSSNKWLQRLLDQQTS